MSYILDALRRLEQDRERSRREMDPLEAVLGPDRDVGRGPGSRRLLWISIGVLVLAGSVLTTYWVTRKTVGVPAVPSSTRASMDQSVDLPPAARVPDHLPRPRGLDRSAGNDVPSDSASSVLPGRARIGPRDPYAPLGRIEGPSHAETFGDGDLSAGSSSASAGVDSPLEELRGREDAEVRISAIAWSRSRKDRFAVVNFRTVHEGDRVGDLVVYEIRQDGIVFQKGKERYKVPLGTR